MTTETRMLERRVSNNRADLSSDQQMNHFLAWFNGWSEMQKSDFVAVLAAKGTSIHYVISFKGKGGVGGHKKSMFAYLKAEARAN